MRSPEVMARTTKAAVTLCLLLFSAGCGGTATSEAVTGEELVLTLSERSGSGESGKATFTPLGEHTKVVLELGDRSAGPVARPEPAHIHRGSCTRLDRRAAYGLAAVEDGKSTSTVSVPLSKLRSGAFAIDVHESAEQVERHVACGNLVDARPRIVDPLGHDRIEE